MGVLKEMLDYGHEKLLFAQDEQVGLKTIIAVHSTTLGPACGGTRFWNYQTEEDALYDVLRLSRGMSLKNAAAGLKLGGGKAVIIGDPAKLKGPTFFAAYGRIVDSLGGLYYTAEDVNINETDVGMISKTTAYVTGTKAISGNPSPFTARGIFMGMKAGALRKFGSDNLKGLTVAMQGLGSVGYTLARHLHEEGAHLKVYDLNQTAVDRAAKEFGAQAVPAHEILSTACDIFAPCALGAVLNEQNVHNLKCQMICGAANNVLVNPETAEALDQLGILYLPDYIVNAGGIINCATEIKGEPYDINMVNAQVDNIYQTVLNIIELSRINGTTTYAAAEEYAMGIIRAGAANRGI